MKTFSLFLWYRFKILLKHRGDFILSIINIFINLVLSSIFLLIIYKNTPLLNGWSIYEILLIYGCFLFNKGISDTVTYGLYNIEGYVQKGTLDNLYLKPMSILSQILSSDIDLGQIVNIVSGMFLTIYSLLSLKIPFDFWTFLIFIVSLIFSILVVFSSRLLAMSLAFWTQTSFPIAISVDNLSEFSRYPLSIYNKFIEIFLTFVLPFGIFGYLPIAILTKRLLYWYYFIVLFAIIALLFIALTVWKKGLKHYESSGN